jgi:hypothetical protein
MVGKSVVRSIKKNPRNGEFKEYYVDESLIEKEELDALTIQNERSESVLGVSDPEFVASRRLDLSKYKFPLSLFVRDFSIADEGYYQRLVFFGCNKEGFLLMDGTVLKLEDLDVMLMAKEISRTECGLLYYMYICGNAPSFGPLFRNSFRTLEYDFGTVKSNEFGIREEDEFMRYNIANSNGFEDDMRFTLMGAVYAIPYLYKLFKEKAANVEGRVFIDPFEEIGTIVKEDFADGSVIGVSRIRWFGHYGEDCGFSDGKGWAFIADGIGSARATLPAVELITRKLIEAGAFDPVACRREWTKNFFNGIGDTPDVMERFATFAEYKVDVESKKVRLRVIGDAFAVHVDKNYRIVQILGGESAFNADFRKQKDLSKEAIDLYLAHSNNIEAAVKLGVEPDPEEVAESVADFMPGDKLMLFSDFSDKLWSELQEYINAHGAYETFNDQNFSERSKSVVSNRDQKHLIHVITLRLFIRYLQKLSDTGQLSNFSDLVNLVKESFCTELDDSSFALKDL